VLESGVNLEVLNPPLTPFRGSSADGNNNGVVLRLVYGDVSFLLAADIQSEAENYLVDNAAVLASRVLKVPHHGSRTSTGEEFLRRVSPTQVVISFRAGNQFGHPHPEVLERLKQAVGTAGVYQTAQQGTVEFISDGRQLWVQTQR
jgi:competence protein ComEC